MVDGESGLLVDDVGELAAALGRVLGDEVLRSRLAKGALARARWFTWDATARRALEALAEEATSPRPDGPTVGRLRGHGASAAVDVGAARPWWRADRAACRPAARGPR